MNTQTHRLGRLVVAGLIAASLAACTAAPVRPDAADAARNRLTELQANPALADRAPVALNEAERAVIAAEVPTDDAELTKHLVFMADRKVAIAWAEAEQRFAEDERQTLSDQRERARLDSRTREVSRARGDADAARDRADAARGEMDDAREAARVAESDAEDLRAQITELNARNTERGLLVTLGDVLFETGNSDLQVNASSNLEKLASFLNRYEDRNAVIEGHTDQVGSEDSNFSLSQRRADAVKTYLVSNGVNARRLSTAGKGEGHPVASNDTSFGRQQNRRVEVIIDDIAAPQLP